MLIGGIWRSSRPVYDAQEAIIEQRRIARQTIDKAYIEYIEVSCLCVYIEASIMVNEIYGISGVKLIS